MNDSESRQWHVVLNVSPNATLDEIKKAYRELIIKYHPDRVAGLGDEFRVIAERKAKEINNAYEQAVKQRKTHGESGRGRTSQEQENTRKAQEERNKKEQEEYRKAREEQECRRKAQAQEEEHNQRKQEDQSRKSRAEQEGNNRAQTEEREPSKRQGILRFSLASFLLYGFFLFEGGYLLFRIYERHYVSYTTPIEQSAQNTIAPNAKHSSGAEQKKSSDPQSGSEEDSDLASVLAKFDTEPNRSSAEIEQTVSAWAQAWSSKNVGDYLTFYSDSFVPEKGITSTAWKNQRHKALKSASAILVTLTDMKVTVLDANQAEVTFTQDYWSNNYQDKGRKTLSLQKENRAWKIVRENAAVLSVAQKEEQAIRDSKKTNKTVNRNDVDRTGSTDDIFDQENTKSKSSHIPVGTKLTSKQDNPGVVSNTGNKIGVVESINTDWGFAVIRLDNSSTISESTVLYATDSSGRKRSLTIRRMSGNKASATPEGGLMWVTSGLEIYR